MPGCERTYHPASRGLLFHKHKINCTTYESHCAQAAVHPSAAPGAFGHCPQPHMPRPFRYLCTKSQYCHRHFYTSLPLTSPYLRPRPLYTPQILLRRPSLPPHSRSPDPLPCFSSAIFKIITLFPTKETACPFLISSKCYRHGVGVLPFVHLRFSTRTRDLSFPWVDRIVWSPSSRKRPWEFL